jgi:hypothetical protein
MPFLVYEEPLDACRATDIDLISSSNLLTKDQSEDFKLFMRQLPQLVLGLQQAGIMKADAGKRKSVENNATDVVKIAEHGGSVGFIANKPEITPNDPFEGRNHIAPANYNEEEEREIADISRTASRKSTHFDGPDLTVDHLTKPEPTTSAIHSLGNTPRHPNLTPQILSESG